MGMLIWKEYLHNLCHAVSDSDEDLTSIMERGEAQRASRGEADDIMCENKIFRQQIQAHRFFLLNKKYRQMLDSIRRDKKWVLKKKKNIQNIAGFYFLLFHALKNMAVFIVHTSQFISLL